MKKGMTVLGIIGLAVLFLSTAAMAGGKAGGWGQFCNGEWDCLTLQGPPLPNGVWEETGTQHGATGNVLSASGGNIWSLTDATLATVAAAA
jgi:hypothetical protein